MSPVDDRRVTVGFPVRNGAATFARVMEGILGQTHADLRVIVSDNASTDETPALAADFARRDPRVTVIRHDEAMIAPEHFRWVAEQATTPYFLWIAHDDAHTPDYVAGLLDALEREPAAWLAFPELAPFNEDQDPYAVPSVPFRCDTRGLSYGRRLRLVTHHASIAMYGLWRTDALRRYSWPPTHLGVDWVLMCHAVAGGEVVQVTGPRFLYHVPSQPKTTAERGRDEFYRPVERFPWVKLLWRGATVATDARRGRGAATSRVATFLVLALSHAAVRGRQRLYRALPSRVLDARRRLRRRAAGPPLPGHPPE